jgi:hypothetical protein
LRRALSAAAQRDAISFATASLAAFTTQRVSSRVSECPRCALPISLRKPRDIRACSSGSPGRRRSRQHGLRRDGTRFFRSCTTPTYSTLHERARPCTAAPDASMRPLRDAPRSRRTVGSPCWDAQTRAAEPSAIVSASQARSARCGAFHAPREFRAPHRGINESANRHAGRLGLPPEGCSDENALRPADAGAAGHVERTTSRCTGAQGRTPEHRSDQPEISQAFTPFARRALQPPAAAMAFRSAPRRDA